MKKTIVIILCAVVAFVGIVAGAIGVLKNSSKTKFSSYNLTKISTDDVPETEKKEIPVKEDFLQLDDVNMHYKVYGEEGHPVVLVHDNGLDLESFDETARYLANTYTVYAVDLRNHGKTTQVDRINYLLMASDVAHFIVDMDLKEPYIVGVGDGAITALTIAYRYPFIPGAVISCGAVSSPEGYTDKYMESVKKKYEKDNSPITALQTELPDFTPNDLTSITCPVLIAYGEKDIVKISEVDTFRKYVRSCTVLTAKGEDHSSYITGNGKKAYSMIKTFLDSVIVPEPELPTE